MKKTFILVLIFGLIVSGITSCSSTKETKEETSEVEQAEDKSDTTAKDGVVEKEVDIKGKKIFFVDSYAKDFAWSNSLQTILEKNFTEKGAEIEIFEMNTKNDPSEENKTNMALEAKAIIDESKPDIVIVADDNANKYLLMEYYKDSDLPFISIGVNWQSSIYNLPYENTIVQEEWNLASLLVEKLQEQAKGDKLGFIGPDNTTAKKNAEFSNKLYDNIDYEKEYYVTNYEDFKAKWLMLQSEVDMIIFDTTAGIQDWNEEEGKQFMADNTKVVTGCWYPWVTPYVMIGYTTYPQEVADWATDMAIEVIGGNKPSDYNVVQNEKGDLYINLKIAEALGISFDEKYLEHAKVIR